MKIQLTENDIRLMVNECVSRIIFEMEGPEDDLNIRRARNAMRLYQSRGMRDEDLDKLLIRNFGVSLDYFIGKTEELDGHAPKQKESSKKVYGGLDSDEEEEEESEVGDDSGIEDDFEPEENDEEDELPVQNKTGKSELELSADELLRQYGFGVDGDDEPIGNVDSYLSDMPDEDSSVYSPNIELHDDLRKVGIDPDEHFKDRNDLEKKLMDRFSYYRRKEPNPELQQLCKSLKDRI